MAKTKVQVKENWYDKRLNSFGLAVLAWAIGWVLLLIALSTASMWAYFGFFVLFIFGLNRIVRTIRG